MMRMRRRIVKRSGVVWAMIESLELNRYLVCLIKLSWDLSFFLRMFTAECPAEQ